MHAVYLRIRDNNISRVVDLKSGNSLGDLAVFHIGEFFVYVRCGSSAEVESVEPRRTCGKTNIIHLPCSVGFLFPKAINVYI